MDEHNYPGHSGEEHYYSQPPYSQGDKIGSPPFRRPGQRLLPIFIGVTTILLVIVVVFGVIIVHLLTTHPQNPSSSLVPTTPTGAATSQVQATPTTVAPTPTPTPIPIPTATPTPALPVTYHLAGVIDSCKSGPYGGNYRSALQLTLTISDRTTVSGQVSLNNTASGEGDGNVSGSIDATNHLDFYSGAVITFHWAGTFSAQHTVTDGTVYPIEGRCGDTTGTWTAA